MVAEVKTNLPTLSTVLCVGVAEFYKNDIKNRYRPDLKENELRAIDPENMCDVAYLMGRYERIYPASKAFFTMLMKDLGTDGIYGLMSKFLVASALKIEMGD